MQNMQNYQLSDICKISVRFISGYHFLDRKKRFTSMKKIKSVQVKYNKINTYTKNIFLYKNQPILIKNN